MRADGSRTGFLVRRQYRRGIPHHGGVGIFRRELIGLVKDVDQREVITWDAASYVHLRRELRYESQNDRQGRRTIRASGVLPIAGVCCPRYLGAIYPDQTDTVQRKGLNPDEKPDRLHYILALDLLRFRRKWVWPGIQEAIHQVTLARSGA